MWSHNSKFSVQLTSSKLESVARETVVSSWELVVDILKLVKNPSSLRRNPTGGAGEFRRGGPAARPGRAGPG
jgi:hypothetical protein